MKGETIKMKFLGLVIVKQKDYEELERDYRFFRKICVEKNQIINEKNKKIMELLSSKADERNAVKLAKINEICDNRFKKLKAFNEEIEKFAQEINSTKKCISKKRILEKIERIQKNSLL